MLEVSDGIRIPDAEFSLSFARAGGPGGQNVNKVSSKVLLRWNPAASPALPGDIKARLLTQQRSRLTKEGDLLITSQRFRDQTRNLDDCLDKLREIILQAARPPRVRRGTRPTRTSREQRLQVKRRRSQVKAGRRRPADE